MPEYEFFSVSTHSPLASLGRALKYQQDSTKFCLKLSYHVINLVFHVRYYNLLLYSFSAFYVSFVVTPICSNASELVSSLIFASKKKKENISMTFAQVLME